jgi:predicted SnoaL-like aldol condensation-catalyzing enzyme
MKKLSFLTSIIVGSLLMSCSGNNTAGSGGGMTDTEKKNLETADAVAKMFEAGDYSKAGDYINVDAVDHAGMHGDVVGLDSIKAAFTTMGAMASDMKNDVVKEAASGDYVFQWMKESFTIKKDDPMMGKAGTRNTYNSIEVSRFKDGKVSEHWGFIDWVDVNKMMMSMMPPSSMGNMDMPKMDSAGSKMSKKK